MARHYSSLEIRQNVNNEVYNDLQIYICNTCLRSPEWYGCKDGEFVFNIDGEFNYLAFIGAVHKEDGFTKADVEHYVEEFRKQVDLLAERMKLGSSRFHETCNWEENCKEGE